MALSIAKIIFEFSTIISCQNYHNCLDNLAIYFKTTCLFTNQDSLHNGFMTITYEHVWAQIEKMYDRRNVRDSDSLYVELRRCWRHCMRNTLLRTQLVN